MVKNFDKGAYAKWQKTVERREASYHDFDYHDLGPAAPVLKSGYDGASISAIFVDEVVKIVGSSRDSKIGTSYFEYDSVSAMSSASTLEMRNYDECTARRRAEGDFSVYPDELYKALESKRNRPLNSSDRARVFKMERKAAAKLEEEWIKRKKKDEESELINFLNTDLNYGGW